MLLTTIRRRLGDDHGAALAAVIGLLAFSLLVTTVVVSSVVGTTSYTSGNRAGVQSQAAAEAGIAAAHAGLIAGTCAGLGGSYQSATGAVPRYVATIWTGSGTTWTRACPSDTSTEVKILSTGYAQAAGVGGVTNGDRTHLEAILSSVAAQSGSSPSGPTIYAYSSAGLAGSGNISSVNGSSPSILVKTGNVTCSGSSAGPADWVVNAGNLTVNGSCNITGNAWTSGTANLSGSVQVTGNLVANVVTLSGSSRVGGSSWSNGATSLAGTSRIGVNASAASLVLPASTSIGGNAWILGLSNVGGTITGNLTTRTRSGTGSVGSQTLIPAGPGPSPYVKPVQPVVPPWVDFTYKVSDWPGYTIVTLSGVCTQTVLAGALTTIGTNPGVIDARACVAGSGIQAKSFTLGGSTKLAIQNNLAIIANRFELSGSAGFTSAVARNLWLITPDTTANLAPTCPSGGVFALTGSFSFSAPIATMIYTPCAAPIGSSTSLRGQIYAGSVSVAGSAQIGYVPVGLPGYNLSTGGTQGGPAASESQRTILSLRNVQVGN